MHDVRYAIRGLLRNPAFSWTAILVAALAIGATSAVFSAVDRILFRALPYAQEDRLVSVGMMAPLDINEFFLAEPYIDLRHHSGPFEQMTAFQAGAIETDLTEGEPVRLKALRIEASFLDVFGIQPIVGRSFTREEDSPNGPNVAMISYRLWWNRFAGDRQVVGRTLLLDGAPCEIVGVLPKNFVMPTLTESDLLFPLALNEATERSGRAFRVFGKLKEGITPPQAAAELQPQFERLRQTVPPQFRREVSFRVRLVRDRQVGDVRIASLALLGAVIAVLLIACANIASLLLARSVAREREMRVRAALGATRSRLARQALTESMVVSAIGGIAGCGFAWALLRVFIGLAPVGLPRLNEATLDARALLFTVAATLGSGLLFGLAPALSPVGSLVANGLPVMSRAGGRIQTAFVVVEIAFSMVLLTSAGLLLRSLSKMESVPLGFERDHTITARFVLGRQRYGTPAQQLAFFNQLEQQFRSLPGADAVALTDSMPPSGGMRGRPFASIAVEGQPPLQQGTGGMVGWRYVTPGYFRALGIPILRGRPFVEEDRDSPTFAVVLSESLARLMFAKNDPIGRHILKGPHGEWSTVVGVAHDVTNLGATRESWPEYYVIRKQTADFNFQNQEPPTGWRSAILVARTSVDPKLVAGSLRAVLRSLDATLPVEVETMQRRLDQVDQRPRFNALLLSTFAVFGVLIAAVGLFGLMSFRVGQRKREIGVRLALGATPQKIVRMTLGSAARWTLLGIIAGTAASLAVTRLLRSLLFQVEPNDPIAITAAVALLCVVELLAGLSPAWRASRQDPMLTLRQD
jgi:putative ABC transport system permease protein